MKDILKLGLIQLTSQDDIAMNAQTIVKSLEAFGGKIDIVTTPENSLFMRGSSEVEPPRLDLSDSRLDPICDWAKKTKTHVHLGSVPLADDEHEGRRTNATVWIDTKGDRQVVYRKIHLFDVDVEGETPRRESANFTSGTAAKIVEVEGWKIGLSICYDLRFAELYSKYAQNNCDMIFIPSAFLVPTGRAHWEILVRARAVESQCYVAAAAQSGEHRSGTSSHRTYGRSMLVDPWGEIVAEAPSETSGSQLIVKEIAKARIQQVRSQIPMRGHRKIDKSTPVEIRSMA